MYKRNTSTGQTVKWEPDDKQLALDIMRRKQGNGVPEDVELPKEGGVTVDSDTAREIREEYDRRHRQKHPDQYPNDEA